MEAIIYKIDRLNTHNGPGYRTVIYFKGCPLHCTWCHNPEGISPKKEVWFNASKCIGCGTCIDECPENALSLSEKGITIDREKCTGCQHCTNICPSKALEKIGEDYSVDDLMKLILQDKFLFETSEGGITVTGGEPGMYAEFVGELFKQCKGNGIQTAFDTSGMISEKALEKIIPYTDIIFLDIKILDNKKSILHTGLPVDKLKKTVHWIKNFQKEHHFPRLEIRTPLVPSATDDLKNLKEIEEYIKAFLSEAENWELCMFNDLCEDKYIRMNTPWKHKGQKHSSADYAEFVDFSKDVSIPVTVTGFFENK